MNSGIKRISVLIILAFTIAGCATTDKIILPSGEEGLMIRCEEVLSYCYKQASKSCPGGYEIKDKTTSSNLLVPVYDLTVMCK